MKPHDPSMELRLEIAGDPAQAREQLAQVMTTRGWTMHPNPDGWSGMASKGNKIMNVLFGAFAQYHEMHFSMVTTPAGNTGLTLYRTNQGCAGGLLGMHKVKKEFTANAAEIQGALAPYIVG